MTFECELKRYAAYYKGWCQAFGEHESLTGEDTGISWLLSEKQIGFISPRKLTKLLLREILRKRETPTLTIGRNSVQIGTFDYRPSEPSDESALRAIGIACNRGIPGNRSCLPHLSDVPFHVWYRDKNSHALQQEAFVHHLQGNWLHEDQAEVRFNARKNKSPRNYP